MANPYTPVDLCSSNTRAHLPGSRHGVFFNHLLHQFDAGSLDVDDPPLALEQTLEFGR